MSETGVFPSFYADGKKKRTRGDGKQHNEVRLRCIKDGYVRTYVDDGFDREAGEPNQARQALCRALGRREDGLPVFFLDEGSKPLSVAGHGGHNVEARIADEEILAKMAENVAARQAREDVAGEFVAKVRAQQAEHLASAIQAVNNPAPVAAKVDIPDLGAMAESKASAPKSKAKAAK